MKKSFNTTKSSGFSLIEILIAMFIGSFLLIGLIKIFETTSNMNRTQNGLASIQQNGRFAILQMKQNIEQAGYQYCMSSGEEGMDAVYVDCDDPNNAANLACQTGIDCNDPVNDAHPLCTNNRGTIQRSWAVYTDPVFPGVVPLLSPSENYFDTANLIRGHECGLSSCSPGFDDTDPADSGFDDSYPIPNIGTSDGDRLASTDVLTIRYLSGNGLEVDSIAQGGTDQKIISLVDSSAILQDNKALVASCNSKPLTVVRVDNSVAGFITVNIPDTDPFPGGSAVSTRVFGLATDVKSITYYVANNIVDGRSIPTLYSVVNGTVNALVEGVDRFDVLYALDLGLDPKLRQYFTADQVQNLDPNLCKPLPEGIGQPAANVTGCGWRSVDLIQIHLLLNSIHNSSTKNNEQFVYSIDGNGLRLPSTLPSGLPTYNLHRREFFSVINLKNSQN